MEEESVKVLVARTTCYFHEETLQYFDKTLLLNTMFLMQPE